LNTNRKIEILDAFMLLVGRFGLDKTTMQDVAKEVGISVGVIYKDFKNKEDLIDLYIQRMNLQINALIDQILEQDLSSEQMLHDLFIKLYQHVYKLSSENRGFWQFLHGGEGFKCFRNFKKLHEHDPVDLRKRIEKVMQEGVDDGSFEIEDVSKTAYLFSRAFKSILPDLISFGKSWDNALVDFEDMFAFLIKAIRKA
jgi:AcrR family transcriptional regulator